MLCARLHKRTLNKEAALDDSWLHQECFGSTSEQRLNTPWHHRVWFCSMSSHPPFVQALCGSAPENALTKRCYRALHPCRPWSPSICLSPRCVLVDIRNNLEKACSTQSAQNRPFQGVCLMSTHPVCPSFSDGRECVASMKSPRLAQKLSSCP